MSRIIRYEQSQTTSYSGLMSAAVLAGTMISGYPSNLLAEGLTSHQNRHACEVIFVTKSNKQTFSRYSSPITGEFITATVTFEQAVSNFYARLMVNQEPLGAEFEKVLYENLWDLYES